MSRTAKTIQIFLPDGNPRSLRIAEITSRTVSAVLIPRSKLQEAQERVELSGVGVYILFGDDEASPKAYIGEAENCLTRLKQHNKSKDFWTHAIAFVSKTQFFTKTHIKFLEWQCACVAIRTGRYSLENGNNPSKPHVSESVEADLYDNFETMRILASTLGYPIFEEIKKSKSKDIIGCKGKDANATGSYSEDGLTVFVGSTCNLKETKAAGSWIVGMRKTLIENGVLAVKDSLLVFQRDHVFSSPSAAAAVVLARRANGWVEWKYKSGQTLDRVVRQSETK
jgi:hypothetical protein